MDNLDLSDLIKTKDESIDFATRLSSISEKIYETGFNLESLFINQFGIKKKDKLIAMIRNNNINVDSAADLNEFFNKIQKKISSLPIISLTVAFDPNEDTLNKLSEWFSLNLKKQFLFDIKTDRKIIGGAAILTNGKYSDYSIKPKFDAILNDLFINKSIPAPVQNQNAQSPAPSG